MSDREAIRERKCVSFPTFVQFRVQSITGKKQVCNKHNVQLLRPARCCPLHEASDSKERTASICTSSLWSDLPQQLNPLFGCTLGLGEDVCAGGIEHDVR